MFIADSAANVHFADEFEKVCLTDFSLCLLFIAQSFAFYGMFDGFRFKLKKVWNGFSELHSQAVSQKRPKQLESFMDKVNVPCHTYALISLHNHLHLPEVRLITLVQEENTCIMHACFFSDYSLYF